LCVLFFKQKHPTQEEYKMTEDENLAALAMPKEEEGAFFSSLKRNNRQIRDDRATAIAEDTELVYKRKIEDLELSIKKMKREQENMLDLSPTNAQSLILASDFNSAEYVEKDIDLGIKIRNTEITLEIAKKRYQYLFGGI
jgi:hypothetical protein